MAAETAQENPALADVAPDDADIEETRDRDGDNRMEGDEENEVSGW
jgi:hypothetical protein